MARSTALIEIRNKKLISRYAHFSNIREHGKVKYNYEFILAQLSKEFHLAERTIENILDRSS